MDKFIYNAILFHVEIVKVFLFLYGIIKLSFRKHAIRNGILFITVWTGMIEFCQYLSLDTLLYYFVLQALGVFLSATFCFEGKPFQLFTSSFISFFFISILDMAVAWIVPLSISIIPWQIGVNSVNIFILLFLTLFFHKKEFPWSDIKSFLKTNRRYSMLLALLTACSAVLISYSQIITEKYNSIFTLLISISTFILFLVLIGGFFILVQTQYTNSRYQTLLKMNEEFLDAKNKYYEMLSKKDEETRRFRHDIKNHILCLQKLYNENRIEELGNYLSSLEQAVSTLSSITLTGNPIIDAILTDTKEKYPDIMLEINGLFPQQGHITSMDLCTIFSNAVINAADAVSNLPSDQKRITISITKKDKFYHILIKNPTSSNPSDEKKLPDFYLSSSSSFQQFPPSSKKDLSLHGFGLKNIKESVETNNGSLTITHQNNEFALDIILPF